jgi:hypothetical protein
LFVIGGLFSLVAGTILLKRLAPRGRLLVGNAVQNFAAAVALAPLAFGFESFGEVVPSWRLIAALALSRLARLGLRPSPVVPPSHRIRRVRGNRGERLIIS